jgi:uncharacterized protein (TIGR03790 family)
LQYFHFECHVIENHQFFLVFSSCRLSRFVPWNLIPSWRTMKPACIFLFLLALPTALRAQAPVDYRDVGLIVNDNDTVSIAIGEYFAQKRALPSRNVIHIRVPARETIVDSEFVNLRAQVETYLTGSGLADSLNYLVLTKGVPHRVDRGGTGGDLNSKSACVDAELMLILGQWQSHIGMATLVIPPSSVRVHPYYGRMEHYRRKNLIPGTGTPYDMYLVTRLTGLTKDEVLALIDRSGPHTLVDKDSALFVLDQDPTPIDATYNNNMVTAANTLAQRGWRVLLNRDSVYVTAQRNVLGYASWGSNDNYSGRYTQFARPMNHWSPASIAETYVSTGARNFTPGQTGGQSRIADLFTEGCTGASGYVFEPFSLALTWVNILFDRYTAGYNLAESFYMANPTMSWMAIVVGDPKTSIVTSPARPPHPTIVAVGPQCQNGAATLEAHDVADGTMHWFRGDSAAVKAAGRPYTQAHPLWIGSDSLLTRLLPNAGPAVFTFVNENIMAAGFAEVRFDVLPALAAGFRTERDTVFLDANPTARFTDTTARATTWSWSFGDGSGTSTARAPEYTYTKAGTYTVRLSVSDGVCSATISRQIRVEATMVGMRLADGSPASLSLDPASPMPFRDATTIRFSLPRNQEATVTVVDILGREKAILMNGSYAAGSHTVTWGPKDLPAGIYFCVLQCADGSRTIVLMRI